MESNLENVLTEGEQQAQDEPQQEPEQQPAEQQQVEAQAPTGEEAAPPAETDDPEKTRLKGLEAGLLAERRKRQEAEIRRQELERQLAQFQRPQQPQQEPAEDGPPDPTKYENDPQTYWRLLARYEARQELAQTLQQAQAAQAQREQQERYIKVQERMNSAVASGQAKYRDFDVVINTGLGPFLNPTLHEALADCDATEDVSYYLGKNPAEAARIASLPERQMARELTKLEAKVTAPQRASIPQTLTSARDTRGQFARPALDGMTPLDAVLGRTK